MKLHGSSFQPFPPLSFSHTPNIYTISIHTQITHSLSYHHHHHHHHPNFSGLYQDLFHNTQISHLGFTISPFQTTMKVHPVPHKRNITVRYDFASQSTPAGSICRQKKLQRLPHNFSSDLELLFYSDATSWFRKRLNRLDGG
ncbi:hypothetical protein Hanom_Chr03g00229141 [Helianthus anomalus]